MFHELTIIYLIPFIFFELGPKGRRCHCSAELLGPFWPAGSAAAQALDAALWTRAPANHVPVGCVLASYVVEPCAGRWRLLQSCAPVVRVAA